MKLKASYIVAAIFTVFLAAWMLQGEVQLGGQVAADEQAPTIAEREQNQTKSLFRVTVAELKPQMREETVLIRGRTRANAIVPVRAETGGILEQRFVNKGDKVEQGQLLCKIEAGAREAALSSAMAQLHQAQEDHSANEKLAEKGFASKTKMRQLKFGLDAAKAQVAQAKLELSRVEVKANASGIVQDPIAEVGDVLTAGGTCVTLIDSTTMYFVGQVNEQTIHKLKTGMNAGVQLVGGEQIIGKVAYIAPSADPSTRSFLVEIQLGASQTQVRDGLTATAGVLLPPLQAFKISPSWLTLADNGDVGIKYVDENDTVQFQMVKIISQSNEGFWISGPEPGTRVVTLGQEFVSTGELVEPVPHANTFGAEG